MSFKEFKTVKPQSNWGFMGLFDSSSINVRDLANEQACMTHHGEYLTNACHDLLHKSLVHSWLMSISYTGILSTACTTSQCKHPCSDYLRWLTRTDLAVKWGYEFGRLIANLINHRAVHHVVTVPTPRKDCFMMKVFESRFNLAWQSLYVDCCALSDFARQPARLILVYYQWSACHSGASSVLLDSISSRTSSKRNCTPHGQFHDHLNAIVHDILKLSQITGLCHETYVRCASHDEVAPLLATC